MLVDRKNRGAESMISALILIVITVFAFGIAYAAYNSWASAQRNGTLLELQERISIESIRFNSNTNASLFITNLGKVDVTINWIEINDAVTISNVTIPCAGSQIVNINYSRGFVPQDTYTFKLTSSKGTQITASARYTGVEYTTSTYTTTISAGTQTITSTVSTSYSTSVGGSSTQTSTFTSPQVLTSSSATVSTVTTTILSPTTSSTTTTTQSPSTSQIISTTTTTTTSGTSEFTTATATQTSTSTGETTPFSDGFENNNFDLWTDGATTWLIGTTGTPAGYTPHTGTSMAYAGPTNDGSLTSDNIDLTGASSFVVSFWYMDDDLDAGTDFELYFFDGVSYDLIADLNLATEDVWTQYTAEINDAQYFVNNFRIRFSATPENNENAFVDDVTITKKTAEPTTLRTTVTTTTTSGTSTVLTTSTSPTTIVYEITITTPTTSTSTVTTTALTSSTVISTTTISGTTVTTTSGTSTSTSYQKTTTTTTITAGTETVTTSNLTTRSRTTVTTTSTSTMSGP